MKRFRPVVSFFFGQVGASFQSFHFAVRLEAVLGPVFVEAVFGFHLRLYGYILVYVTLKGIPCQAGTGHFCTVWYGFEGE